MKDSIGGGVFAIGELEDKDMGRQYIAFSNGHTVGRGDRMPNEVVRQAREGTKYTEGYIEEEPFSGWLATYRVRHKPGTQDQYILELQHKVGASEDDNMLPIARRAPTQQDIHNFFSENYDALETPEGYKSQPKEEWVELILDDIDEAWFNLEDAAADFEKKSAERLRELAEAFAESGERVVGENGERGVENLYVYPAGLAEDHIALHKPSTLGPHNYDKSGINHVYEKVGEERRAAQKAQATSEAQPIHTGGLRVSVDATKIRPVHEPDSRVPVKEPVLHNAKPPRPKRRGRQAHPYLGRKERTG